MTLIELIIVVVIVGILAAIAVPSYSRYVIRSQRVDGTAALLSLATEQEKFYLQCGAYAGTFGGEDSCADGEIGYPETSEKAWYQLSITAADDTDFTIRAVPVTGGAQARDTDCAFFEVTGRGVRSASSAECWD